MEVEKLLQQVADTAAAAVEKALAARDKGNGDATPEPKTQEPDEATKRAIAAIQHTFSIGQPSGKAPEPGQTFGRMVRALVSNDMDEDKALRQVKAGRFGKEAHIIEAVERQMAAGESSAGGYLLPAEMSQEVIELLRARTVVRRSNPTTVSMETGTLTIPKVTSGSTGQYVGENAPPEVSQMGTGQVVLTYKKLVCLVPVSNDLLLFGGASTDNLIRNDIINGMGVREDVAFLRGTASEHTPRGLRYWAPAANVTATAGTSLANVREDLQALTNALQAANVPMINPWIFMHPRSKNHLLWNCADGNGNLVFHDEIMAGKLGEFNLGVTTSIPANLGGGGNESELIVADMVDAILGESSQIMISAGDQASYTDEDDNVQSAFANDQLVIRAVARHDFVVRRVEAVAVKTGILYGT